MYGFFGGLSFESLLRDVGFLRQIAIRLQPKPRPARRMADFLPRLILTKLSLIAALTGLFCEVSYAQPTAATLTSPTPGSLLPSTVTFTWTAGSGATAYWLSLGTVAPGSASVWESGAITTTTVTAKGLPLNGAKIYVTLLSRIGGSWVPVYYTYTEAQTARLISPAPGTMLPGAAAFSWTPGSGATAYFLSIGTNGPDSANVWESGSTSATSVTVPGLPLNGGTLNATLFSMIGGAWQPVFYTFPESGVAAITSPTPGSLLTGSTTFEWSAGRGATAYFLSIGTKGPNSSNLWESGSTTATSATVGNLPLSGATIYANLFSLIGGVWQSNYFTYSQAQLAAITSPAPGTALPNSTTFQWTPGKDVTAYFLSIGTRVPGSANIWESGSITATQVTASGLPANGTNWGTMDAWLQCAGPVQGTTVTVPVLGSCTVGNESGGFALTETPLAPMQVAGSQGALGAAVNVAGTTYPNGVATQSLSFNNNFDQQFMTMYLPTNVTTYTLNANGYITFAPPNTGADIDNYFDYLDAQDVLGHDGFVIQLHSGLFQGCTYCVFLETNPGFETTHSATGIPITPGQRYAFSVQANESTGIAQLALYNPTTFAQVGSTISSPSQSGEPITIVLAGNVETGTADGFTSYFEDIMLDWGGHQSFPNIPSAAPIYVTLSSKINGVWKSVYYAYN